MEPLTPDELSRDFDADLAVINAATAGPWIAVKENCFERHMVYREGYPQDGPVAICDWLTDTKAPPLSLAFDARFIAAARTGWEIAIRRAKAAEAEVERLRSMVEGLAARVAAQSELLSRKAEDKP